MSSILALFYRELNVFHIFFSVGPSHKISREASTLPIHAWEGQVGFQIIKISIININFMS